MDGTLTVPVIDFKLMRSRVGVPDGQDILDFISTQTVEMQARSNAAIKDVEAKVIETHSSVCPLSTCLIFNYSFSWLRQVSSHAELTHVFRKSIHKLSAANSVSLPICDHTRWFI